MKNVNYKFPTVLYAFLYNSYLFVANTRWCLRIYPAVLPLSLTKRRPSIWSNHKQQEPISTFKHWKIKFIWIFLSGYNFMGAPLMHIWAKRPKHLPALHADEVVCCAVEQDLLYTEKILLKTHLQPSETATEVNRLQSSFVPLKDGLPVLS